MYHARGFFTKKHPVHLFHTTVQRPELLDGVGLQSDTYAKLIHDDGLYSPAIKKFRLGPSTRHQGEGGLLDRLRPKVLAVPLVWLHNG